MYVRADGGQSAGAQDHAGKNGMLTWRGTWAGAKLAAGPHHDCSACAALAALVSAVDIVFGAHVDDSTGAGRQGAARALDT